MATTNRRGTVIGVALQLDWQKAVADAQKAGKVINTTFATALNAPAGSRGPTLLQQAKATAVAMEGQAKVAEIASRSSRNLAAADVQAARASAELAKAKLYEARAQQTAARETERAERAQRRSTFGAGFQRGFASTRVNVGAASPILSSATRGGSAGVAGAAVAVAAAAGADALSRAAQQAIAFDKAMRNVNSITGESEAGFRKLEQRLIALADKDVIRRGPGDLAEALYEIMGSLPQTLQGTARIDAAFKRLEESAIGAGAGLTTTKVSATALGTILNSGIKGVENERQAMDLLFQTVNVGKGSFEELASALPQVIQTASQMGVSFQEVGAFLATASLQGQSFSDASNDLLNVITKIVRPSKEAESVFRQYGISFGANALQAKGLTGVLDEVIKKVGGNKQALSNLFPDMQAFRGVLSGASKDGKDFSASLSAMYKSAGSTQKAAGEQAKSMAAQLENLQKELEVIAVKFGPAFIETLRAGLEAGKPFLDIVKELADSFNKLQPEEQRAIVQTGLWGAAALTAVSAISTITSSIMELVKAYGVLKAAQATAGLTGAAAGAGLLTGGLMVAGGVAMSNVQKQADQINKKADAEGAAQNGMRPDQLRREAARYLAKAQEIRSNPQSYLGIAGFGNRQQGDAAAGDAEFLQPGSLRARAATEGRMTADARKQVEFAESEARRLKARADEVERRNKAARARSTDVSVSGTSRDTGTIQPPSRSKKKAEGDGEKLTGDILRGIAKGINTPKGEASCAYFASQALRKIGAKVPVTAGAKELRDRALKAGYQQIDPKDARAGDLVVYRGAKYGALKFNEGGERVGYHVAVATGDGKVVESSGGRKSSSRSLMRPGVSVYRRPDGDLRPAVDFAQDQAELANRRAKNEADALSDLSTSDMQATIKANIEAMGKTDSKMRLDGRRAGIPWLINRMAKVQETEIATRMTAFDGPEHTDAERKARRAILESEAKKDRQKVAQDLEEAYQKQVEALRDWKEKQAKVAEEAAKENAEAAKSEKDAAKESADRSAKAREGLVDSQVALAEAKSRELEAALASVEDEERAGDLLKRYQAEQVRAAGLSLDLALAKNAREASSEAEMLALNEAAIIAYRTAIASIQAKVGAMGTETQARIDDAKVVMPWHPDYRTPEEIAKSEAWRKRRADLVDGFSAGAGQVAGALVTGGGRGAQAEAKRFLEDTVRGTLTSGVQDMAHALLTNTEGMTAEQKKAAEEQKKAAGAHLQAAAALTASAGALAALSGQQGGKKQGMAVLGALAGYYASTRTGMNGKNSDGAGLAELGINLATGNFLGAGLQLLGGKLKLPKFATGGRMTGGSMTPIPGGIVLDGNKPEIFVPDAPGYILPDANAAFSRLRESIGGDGSAGGRSLVYSPTIIHQGDINDRADRRYFEQRERDVLQDVLFSLGG